METGKDIHHKMCGNDGERSGKVRILNEKGKKTPAPFLLNGYEPETNTVYQFHGCHWHGHTCLKNCTKRQQKIYKDTCQIDCLIKYNGYYTKYNLLLNWKCEKPILKNFWFGKEFTPYPHLIVYEFEAILGPFNEHPTYDLTYLSRHIPIGVAIHDTLGNEPVYLVDENPKGLIERFIEVLTGKQEAIATDVLKRHPYPSDFHMLPGEVQEQWRQRVNQVLVIGFNSGKYDIDMVKEYFLREIIYNEDNECNDDVFAAKKENDYMFLTIPRFKFSDVKNYIRLGLSYDAWCKPMGCRLQKLMFLYEWLDSYEKLSHVGLVSYEDFYSSLKPTITRDELEQFFKMFRENDCTAMGDWLWVYNVADVLPFIEAFRKMAGQYYPDKIDVCKDAVSIPGTSMTYVLNKSLEKNKKLELYSPGGISHLCQDKREELQHCSCNSDLKCGGYCEEC